MVEINFPIKAVAKGRPRHTKSGHTYTPQKTRDFEKSIACIARSKFKKKPLTGPLVIRIMVYLQRPKSSRRKYPSVRPDLDNYLKSICDSLNGIIFEDDAQIIQCTICKYYAERDEIDISIWNKDETWYY